MVINGILPLRAGAADSGRCLGVKQTPEPVCNIMVMVDGIPAEMREAHDPLPRRAKDPTFPSSMPRVKDLLRQAAELAPQISVW